MAAGLGRAGCLAALGSQLSSSCKGGKIKCKRKAPLLALSGPTPGLRIFRGWQCGGCRWVSHPRSHFHQYSPFPRCRNPPSGPFAGCCSSRGAAPWFTHPTSPCWWPSGAFPLHQHKCQRDQRPCEDTSTHTSDCSLAISPQAVLPDGGCGPLGGLHSKLLFRKESIPFVLQGSRL